MNNDDLFQNVEYSDWQVTGTNNFVEIPFSSFRNLFSINFMGGLMWKILPESSKRLFIFPALIEVTDSLVMSKPNAGKTLTNS